MHQTVNIFKTRDLLMSAISCIKRKLVFVVFLLVIIVSGVFLIYNFLETVPSGIKVKNNSGEILKLDDEYFYCAGDKIKNCDNSSVLYNGNENVIAAASDKNIYVLDGMKISKITSEGKIVAEKKLKVSSLENSCPQIYFFDDMVFVSIDNCVDKEFIFDEELNTIDINELKRNSDHYEINRTEYFIVDNDNSFLTIAEYEDKSSFIALTDKSDGREIFSTGRTISIYDNCLFLYYCNSSHDKFDLNSQTIISSFDNTNGFSYSSAKINRNHVISVGMKTNCSDIEYSDRLKDHHKDIIEITDTNGNFIATHETKKHERIIFYDNEKAVTYYNGKYRTYDLNDWHLISKQTADEIQNDGSYTFESCGDYVFVFDDNSGNLLNSIDVS